MSLYMEDYTAQLVRSLRLVLSADFEHKNHNAIFIVRDPSVSR